MCFGVLWRAACLESATTGHRHDVAMVSVGSGRWFWALVLGVGYGRVDAFASPSVLEALDSGPDGHAVEALCELIAFALLGLVSLMPAVARWSNERVPFANAAPFLVGQSWVVSSRPRALPACSLRTTLFRMYRLVGQSWVV